MMRFRCCAALLLQTASGWRLPHLAAPSAPQWPDTGAHSPFRHTPLHCGMSSDLAEEMGTDQIAEVPIMFTKGDEQGFQFQQWEVHRSSSRYARQLLGLLFGTTTRRIYPTLVVLGLFASAVDLYDDVLAKLIHYPELRLPLTPFELTAPVLGLLLVFRTDASYSRFNSGSESSWDITSSMRTVSRRLLAFTGKPECPLAERDAALDIIDASCMLHGWIMQEYLKGEVSQASDADIGVQAELMRKALGVSREESSAVELDRMADQASVTPYLALSALSLGMSQRLPSLTDQERIAVDDSLQTVTCALGKCESILRTPIPLGYTRALIRYLVIWNTLIPFALVKEFSDFGEGPVVVLATLFIGYTCLSIEDIATQIEEPFAILPLHLHQNWLMWDVEQVKGLMRWSIARRQVESKRE